MKLQIATILILIGGGCAPDVFSREADVRRQSQIAEHTGTFPPVKIGMKFDDLIQQIKDLNPGGHNVYRENEFHTANSSIVEL